MRHHKLFLRFHRRPLDNFDVSIRSSLQRGRIQAQQLPPPPHPGGAFFRHCREPVLPEHRADLMWRLLRKRITGKECEYILVVREQEHFRVGHNRILAPRPQRSEPQFPIKARLIWRIDSGWLIQLLWLVAKRICDPSLSVCGALEFNFISSARHYREESVTIGDPERFKCAHRRGG